MQNHFPKKFFSDIKELLTSTHGPQESETLAYIILDEVYGLSKTDIILDNPIETSEEQENSFSQLTKKLLTHEPIQYLLNKAEFYGHEYFVDHNVLIPRQETELLIQIIGNYKNWHQSRIADIGTGSGCIACSLALTIDEAEVTGFDISSGALDVARKNGKKLKANANFELLDILTQELPKQSYDLIVSNPPYVMNKEKELMNINVLDFEPNLALFVSDNDPLHFYRTIMKKAKTALIMGGVLFFEINEQFGEQTLLLFEEHGYSKLKLYQDLNGKDRFVSAELE